MMKWFIKVNEICGRKCRKNSKYRFRLFLFLIFLGSCSPYLTEESTLSTVTYPPNQRPANLPEAISWQVQYNGELDLDIDVSVFNLDLFDTTPDQIKALHRRRVFVICYFNAGAYEDWRPDAEEFPSQVLGKKLAGWPGERWLDIRRMDTLSRILELRLDLAVQKGCDGVDPDNINGYTNDTGFPLSAEDQLAYNRWLADAAHQRGLAIGLKNDHEQAAELVDDFDWIVNEECFTYQECHLLQPFVQAGKPVFVIEYDATPEEVCPQANRLGYYLLIKNLALDAFRVDCGEYSGDER